jgi:hypothetical protein
LSASASCSTGKTPDARRLLAGFTLHLTGAYVRSFATG